MPRYSEARIRTCIIVVSFRRNDAVWLVEIDRTLDMGKGTRRVFTGVVKGSIDPANAKRCKDTHRLQSKTGFVRHAPSNQLAMRGEAERPLGSKEYSLGRVVVIGLYPLQLKVHKVLWVEGAL